LGENTQSNYRNKTFKIEFLISVLLSRYNQYLIIYAFLKNSVLNVLFYTKIGSLSLTIAKHESQCGSHKMPPSFVLLLWVGTTTEPNSLCLAGVASSVHLVFSNEHVIIALESRFLRFSIVQDFVLPTPQPTSSVHIHHLLWTDR
jgi:hypothetical protein